MSGRYARPVLCRLCGFPAPDGGVPVSQLDGAKLSEWCLRMMNTELDEEGLDKAVFCQFCVAEARFEINQQTGREKPLLFDSFKDETHFSEGIIQACAVELSTSHFPRVMRAKTGIHKKRTRCIYCKHAVVKYMQTHIQRCHKKEAIRCDLRKCSTYFLTQEQKQKHHSENHKLNKNQCVYCKKTVVQRNLWQHVTKVHKSEQIIKCSFTMCATYFLSKEELQQHEKEVHKLKEIVGLECVYCKNTYIGPGSLRSHIHKRHFAVQIKCKWRGCALYFLTKEDRDQHFEQSHFEEVQEKRFQCDLCDFKTSLKVYMERHYINSHAQLEFKCPHCPNILGSRSALRLHLRVHEEKKACSFCKRQISYRGFRLHSLKNRCKKCDYETKCASDRSKHVLSCKLKNNIRANKLA